MAAQSLVIFLAIGLVRYLLTGVVGAFAGGFLFSHFGISLGIANELVVTIIQATVGAVIVVFTVRILA